MSKEYIPKDEVEQALIKEAAHLLHHYKRYLSVSDVVNELIEVVQRFPAADVVPAVKCQDCVYAHPLKDSKYDYLCHYWNGHSCNQNQFCSQGKKGE